VKGKGSSVRCGKICQQDGVCAPMVTVGHGGGIVLRQGKSDKDRTGSVPSSVKGRVERSPGQSRYLCMKL